MLRNLSWSSFNGAPTVGDVSSAVIGFVTSLSLIVAIGAQNAFVLRQGIARRHVLPVVLVCATADALLQSPKAVWPRYVRADWLAAAYPGALAEQRQGAAAVIAWRCICMELWSQRRRGEALVASAVPAELLMVG